MVICVTNIEENGGREERNKGERKEVINGQTDEINRNTCRPCVDHRSICLSLEFFVLRLQLLLNNVQMNKLGFESYPGRNFRYSPSAPNHSSGSRDKTHAPPKNP